jgi:DNA-directed RNA polymerase subunit RPC12/RpoP
MILCSKCNKKMFVDRLHSTIGHLEAYCLYCGFRKFFHPPEDSEEGRWLLKKEQLKAKATISRL